jgi:hydroxylamine dehydrogenase
MKKVLSAGISIAALTSAAFAANSLDSNPNYVKLKNFKPNPAVTNEQCLMCHKAQDPGIVADWQHSKHAKAGVGCVECHVVPKDYPTAFKAHPMQGSNWTVQIAVSSVTCAKCHAKEVTEYLNSGHARGAAQWLAVNNSTHGFLMSKLAYNYENMKGKHPSLNGYSAKKMAAGIRNDDAVFASNQNNPKQADLGVANICVQCHGTTVKLDSQGRPDAATWPSDGIASLYPDGGVGNCLACHSRHKFSAAEARHPAACTNCHLGPDHPDKEVFESSVHGHIFDSNDKDYNFET